jgi:hypothetical protein
MVFIVRVDAPALVKLKRSLWLSVVNEWLKTSGTVSPQSAYPMSAVEAEPAELLTVRVPVCGTPLGARAALNRISIVQVPLKGSVVEQVPPVLAYQKPRLR